MSNFMRHLPGLAALAISAAGLDELSLAIKARDSKQIDSLHDKINAFFRRDVFKYYFQIRKLIDNRFKIPFDEYGLTIKDINVGMGYFAVQQQGHSACLHGREYIPAS